MGCTTARSHLLPSLLALAASDFSSVAAVPLVLRRTSSGPLMGFRSVFGAFIATIRGGFEFPCGSVAESLTLDGRDHSLDYKIAGLTYPKGSGMDGLLSRAIALELLLLHTVPQRGDNGFSKQSEETEHGRIPQIFQGVKDPPTSNATRHDFLEMLRIALLSSLCGGQTCFDMADCAECNEAFLRQFMRLEHGPPSRNVFSRRIGPRDPDVSPAWLHPKTGAKS